MVEEEEGTGILLAAAAAIIAIRVTEEEGTGILPAAAAAAIIAIRVAEDEDGAIRDHARITAHGSQSISERIVRERHSP